MYEWLFRVESLSLENCKNKYSSLVTGCLQKRHLVMDPIRQRNTRNKRCSLGRGMTDTPYIRYGSLSSGALSGICDADSLLTAAVARLPEAVRHDSFALHQWPVTLLLIIAHRQESNDDCNPIKVIGEDRTVCG